MSCKQPGRSKVPCLAGSNPAALNPSFRPGIRLTSRTQTSTCPVFEGVVWVITRCCGLKMPGYQRGSPCADSKDAHGWMDTLRTKDFLPLHFSRKAGDKIRDGRNRGGRHGPKARVMVTARTQRNSVFKGDSRERPTLSYEQSRR